MATIQPGQEATAEPFMPWGDTYAVGYVTRPHSEPVGRFLEALRQEGERQAERLGGSLHFVQAFP